MSRALGALVALVVVLMPVATAAPGRAESASPSPRTATGPSNGTEDSPVQVTVTKLAPRSLHDPDQFLQVAGSLTNTGSAPVRDLRLRLVVGDRLQSRGELAAADAEPPDLRPVATTVRPSSPDLRPGESTAFDIRLRVRELGLGRLGVYPFGVRVRGTVEGFDDRDPQVGLVQTYLPWFPDGPPTPTRLAWLWPLVDTPSRAPRENIFLDDRLRASLASRGRLSQLVVGATAGGRGLCDTPAAPPPDATLRPEDRELGARCPAPVPVPITYAVDPDLLFSAEALTRDSEVLEGDDLVARPGSVDARRWLESLRADVGEPRTDLVVLPYADPDIAALSGHPLESDLAAASQLGRSVALGVLGQTAVLDVAYPPPGPLAQSAFERALGTTSPAVVLDETALPPPPLTGDPTPDARVAIPTAVRRDATALVVDGALSRLLEAGPATSGRGPRLAEQRWLVETAMVVAEAPSRSRTLLVAPPRRGLVPQAVAANVIADSGRVPWLCPVSLRDVTAGRDVCPGQEGPAGPREPDVVSTLEGTVDGLLPRSALDEVARLRARSDQFTDRVLEPGDAATETKARLLRARLRTESSAWRGAAADGRRLTTLLAEDVGGLREQVVVRVGRKVTLTSDKGTIRANLENSLNQRVTVRVHLSAPAARLSVETTPELVLEPRTVKPVDLQVEALVSGQFVVEAQLLDRTSQPFGEPTRLVVRSTRYGRLALALTGLGAAGLLVAAGVRIARRALRRPHPAGAGQPVPDGESPEPSP